MANAQKQFKKLHQTIKVESEELREKRDIIVNKIKDSLQKAGHPVPTLFNQGSYIYGVGVKPFSDDEEYDIDVGLFFSIKSTDYNAQEIRKWVYDAIKDHTDNVEEKGPCIRIRYKAGYHVDLVCYSRYKDSCEEENFQLAHKAQSWRDCDPEGLKNYIKDAREIFSDTKDSSGSDQLQRVVRYLKRWNDKALPDGDVGKPTGIALLLWCIKYLRSPIFNGDGDPDDLEALVMVVKEARNSLKRISVFKPTPEYEDVFGNITDDDMAKLRGRFSSLYESLEMSKNEPDLEKACKILKGQFGDDFPLGEKEDSPNKAAITIPMVKATKPYAEN